MRAILFTLCTLFSLLSSTSLATSPENAPLDTDLTPAQSTGSELSASAPTPAPPPFTRSEIKVTLPDVTLIDQQGKATRLSSLIPPDAPVILDFFFASCSTICPVLSASFADVQTRLGADSQKVRLLSIAIDPEHDTPEVLRSYLERHHAKPGWTLLTGQKESVVAVMKAFDAYDENKMSHKPLNFIHLPGASHWIRLDGMATGETLLLQARPNPPATSQP